MSERFTITRRIELDAAHRVPDHKSKCFAIHGHRYVVNATLSGPLFTAGEQRGMVMDFGFVKDVMMEVIHQPCDHGLILWSGDRDVLDQLLCPSTLPPQQATKRRRAKCAQQLHYPKWIKLHLMDTVPTAENLAKHWFEELQIATTKFLQDRGDEGWELVKVDAVQVYETPNCVAEYRRPVNG